MELHSYGWRGKEPKDKRDFMFRYEPTVKLPPEIDLRPWDSGIKNQGSLGACGGFSMVALKEFLEIKSGVVGPDLSELYAYYQARVIEGTVGWDSGCFIRDVVKGAAKPGISTESLWPYDINMYRVSPSDAANQNAKDHKVLVYRKISNINAAAMKNCFAAGHSCIFGFMVRPSFEKISGNGIMPMPGFFEKILGGHAVKGSGYKKIPAVTTSCRFGLFRQTGGEYIIVKNSWGKEWGDGGYFYMPVEFVNPLNVQDIWMVEQ